MARDRTGMLTDVPLLLEGDDMPSICVLQTFRNLLTAFMCFEANADADVCVGEHCM